MKYYFLYKEKITGNLTFDIQDIDKTREDIIKLVDMFNGAQSNKDNPRLCELIEDEKLIACIEMKAITKNQIRSELQNIQQQLRDLENLLEDFLACEKD